MENGLWGILTSVFGFWNVAALIGWLISTFLLKFIKSGKTWYFFSLIRLIAVMILISALWQIIGPVYDTVASVTGTLGIRITSTPFVDSLVGIFGLGGWVWVLMISTVVVWLGEMVGINKNNNHKPTVTQCPYCHKAITPKPTKRTLWSWLWLLATIFRLAAITILGLWIIFGIVVPIINIIGAVANAASSAGGVINDVGTFLQDLGRSLGISP